MKGLAALAAGVFAVLVVAVARGGHELPVYPSYYPHEIEIATVARGRAPELLRAGKLHAYVGNAPPLETDDRIGAVESLGSLVVIRLNPNSPHARDDSAACLPSEATSAGWRHSVCAQHPKRGTDLATST